MEPGIVEKGSLLLQDAERLSWVETVGVGLGIYSRVHFIIKLISSILFINDYYSYLLFSYDSNYHSGSFMIIIGFAAHRT
jgi:hypothetical protein